MSRANAVLAIALLAGCRGASTVGVRDSALARELLAHRETDQAIRDTLSQVMQGGGPLDPALLMRMRAIDSANTEWLKGIIAAHGFPRRSTVGEEGANAAFLIVQHAVHDTAFMVRALGLMEPLVADSEARGADVAMLADRIAVQRGGKQRFGTQAKITDGRVILDPIEDSAHVDARRAALGMPTLARYVEVLESVYTAPARP